MEGRGLMTARGHQSPGPSGSVILGALPQELLPDSQFCPTFTKGLSGTTPTNGCLSHPHLTTSKTQG